jgi:hypothetical protein
MSCNNGLIGGIDDSLLFFFLLLVLLFCGFGNGLLGGAETSDDRCRC